MIPLFNIQKPIVYLSKHQNLLHGSVVAELEKEFAEYVGAKYAVSANSESSIIYLLYKYLLDTPTVTLPICIPPVVPSHLANTGVVKVILDRGGKPFDWVGGEYILSNSICRVIDSAQNFGRDCYKNSPNRSAQNFGKDCTDIMLFSFYPTKPLGGLDGGMAVSDSRAALEGLASLVNYGTPICMDPALPSWEKEFGPEGHKMYMNSIQAQLVLDRMRVFSKEAIRLSEIRDKYMDCLDSSQYGGIWSSGSNNSRHLFRVKSGSTIKERDNFRAFLTHHEISTGIHYDPLPMLVTNDYMKWLEDDWNRDEATETNFTPCPYLSIPFHSALLDTEVDHIIRKINQWISS